MINCLHILFDNPLNSTHKLEQLVTIQIVEPHTPQATMQVGKNANLPLQSIEIANLLKYLKLPSFGGEEKEQIEEVMNIFLHKWVHIHSLRLIPKEVRPIHANLLLIGKAYKLVHVS